MKSNNIVSATSIMATFGNIVSYMEHVEREGLTEKDGKEFSFKEQLKSFKEYLDNTKFDYTNLTSEELRAFGAMCVSADAQLFLLPPWAVDFFPEGSKFIEVDDEKHITKEVTKEEIGNIWDKDIDQFGLTKYGVYAVKNDEFNHLVGLRFTEAFDIISKIENANGGKIMRLPNWGKDVYIACQWPDENSKMTHPYLYVTSRYGKCPWKETFPEMFAANWEVWDIEAYVKVIEEIQEKQNKLYEAAAAKYKNGDEVTNDVEEVKKELLEKYDQAAAKYKNGEVTNNAEELGKELLENLMKKDGEE